jgi:hypothetical protein
VRAEEHRVNPHRLEALQALLCRRHSPQAISSAQESVLDPAAPKRIGFHDENGQGF